MNAIILGVLAALSEVHYQNPGRCQWAGEVGMTYVAQIDNSHVYVKQNGGEYAFHGVVNSSRIPDHVALVERKRVTAHDGTADVVDFWKECEE